MLLPRNLGYGGNYQRGGWPPDNAVLEIRALLTAPDCPAYVGWPIGVGCAGATSGYVLWGLTMRMCPVADWA